ncbi:MAG: hypothetical protein FD153_1440 [Rhodospirillaceae bacterium]|nr:MAG: hypothetical protein FD153_1440 [Rhodospirillaceae bacterium]
MRRDVFLQANMAQNFLLPLCRKGHDGVGNGKSRQSPFRKSSPQVSERAARREG